MKILGSLNFCVYLYSIINNKQQQQMSNLKSKVMKAAWTIFRKEDRTMENWSKALVKAWKWAKSKLVDTSGYELPQFSPDRETEKAVMYRAELSDATADIQFSRNIWIPKSIIVNNTVPYWFIQKTMDNNFWNGYDFRIL